MKQHLDPKDLDQLTDSGKQKLREWWKPKVGDFYKNIYSEGFDLIGVGCMSQECECPTMDRFDALDEKKMCLPLLSIGQMIQFLDEHGWEYINLGKDIKGDYSVSCNIGSKEANDMGRVTGESTCDALWSACIELLNKE